MIKVVLRGRFGNQLFQYAVGRHLAIRNNTELRLDLRRGMHGHDLFASNGSVARRLSMFRIKTRFSRPYHVMLAQKFGRLDLIPERRFEEGERPGFLSQILDQPDGTVLRGFFQSEKYFKAIEETIRRDLDPKRPFVGTGHAAIKGEIAASQSVFIHVRRRDYLGTKYEICTSAYYERAFELLRARLDSPRFFVFSDDPQWCREQPFLRGTAIVESQGEQADLLDFDLMRACRHAIIANSSFSWWAAWLINHPEKQVVAPSRWYGDDRHHLEANDDIVPEEWHRLEP